MKLYRHIIQLLFVGLLSSPLPLAAQSVTNMVSGNTLTLDACELGGGVIYDDGGLIGDYSNNFDGYVLIQASAGLTITLSGSYETETYYDYLTIQDGVTTLLNAASGTNTFNVSTTSGQVTIRFHSDGSTVRSGLVINWSVSGISDLCANPVTNLDTIAVTTTSIGLAWSATNALGPFTVICNDQVTNGITTTSYTLTGLNPSTAYDISVVATASADNRCCGDRIMTHTACGSVTMPYSEGFEGMADGSFPPCWIQIINFDDEESIPQVVASHHSSGTRSLMLSCGNTNTPGHYGIVATPPIAGTGSHTVRLWLRASHSGTCVQFGLCDSTGTDYNQYGFTPLQTEYVYTSWSEYTFTWNTTDEGHRLALRMLQSDQGGTPGRRLYIDDMGVEACGVTNLSTSLIDHDRLTLQWGYFGNPTFNVGVRRVGALVDTITMTNVTSPLLITGLQPETQYTFTVYPTCSGSSNIGRSIDATTLPLPNSADGYCSDFRTNGGANWTYNHIYGGCSYSYNYTGDGLHIYNGCSGSDSWITSEQLEGLAGHTITATFTGENNGASVVLGTMVHPEDISSFVPLDTVISDDLRHTLTGTVPAGSTGRYIALRVYNYGWYVSVTFTSVACTPCPLEEPRVYHRRGTTMDIGWAQAYDTVLIQYGPQGFTLGSGTLDTFYNTARATLAGLNPNTDYDLFIYRPCQTPCEDMRYTRRTAEQDYPMPYCEDFNSVYYFGNDWQTYWSVNNNPTFTSQPYDAYTGRALKMASWGFDWDYRSAVLMPDVEVDSNTYMSFYINDNAPNSIITINAVMDENTGLLQTIDTMHINAQFRRTHYTYAFRPSDTLFNRRLVLCYHHPYEYSYYNCYIDELQFSHGSYGTLQATYTSFDTVGFNLTSLTGADSVEITLIGGGNTLVDTIALADIHAFGFGGLDTGILYRCYVRPLDDGCSSYAGYVVTHSYGAGGYGYGNCFDFSDVLSYELPDSWAADSTTLVTPSDYLQLPAHSHLAIHPMFDVNYLNFTFRARSSVQGDTLVFGTLPASSIHQDSSHFTFQPALFAPIDTFVIGTQWDYYMLHLPSTGTDTVRYTFLMGNGTTDLDNIGYSSCPLVNFEVNGVDVVANMSDADLAGSYVLHLIDSAGTDERTILVETTHFHIPSLRANTRYYLTWRCLNEGESCRPTVSVRTGGRVPLPYCENFDVGTANTTLNIPNTWSFVKYNTNDFVGFDSWGPALQLQPYYNRWMYMVLPEFDADSAMVLQANFYTWTEKGVQIGVINSPTDTGSFVPLWTSAGNNWQYPEVDLSTYTNKRVAIRTRADFRLFKLHVYGYPLAKASLPSAGVVKLTTAVNRPYWVRNNWNGYNTLIHIDTTEYYIYDTNGNSDAHITQVCDSTGYTCDNEKYYHLGWKADVPYCYNGSGLMTDITHYPRNHSGPDGWYWKNIRYYLRFHANNSEWVVMPEMKIDSLKRIGMGVEYYATSEKDTLVVGVMTDAYDTLTFTPVDTLVYHGPGDSLQVDLLHFENYADTGRWIALHRPYAQNTHDLMVSRIMVDGCPASLGATASLSRWNQVKIDAPHTPFYVEYGVFPNGQGDGSNTIQRIDSVPTILTLNPETRYNFYFRCDSTGSTCLTAQQVTTLGAPLEVPSCVDFDTVVVGTNPHNWMSRNSGIGVTNMESHSGDKCLQMPVATTSYIITPDINIDSLQKVAVSIWYKVENVADRLVVGVMSNPADLNTFHPIRSLAPMEAGVWQHGMVELSSAPDDAHFIALRARSNRQAGGRNIYVDDIYLTTCAAFDLRVQTLQSGSIDLAWSQIGNPNVTVTVEDNGVLTDTYSRVTTPLHIEPLALQHYYKFVLTSTCDDGSTYCSTNYIDSVSVVSPAPSTGCVNPTDLASPQAVFFSGTYDNPYAHAGAINYGTMHPDSRHTVCYDTSQRDPRTGNQLRTIPEGYTSSVRLGNWSTNAYTPEAEGVIYSLLVDTASFELLLLRYAAVLQDPLHAPADQPRFRMELLDTNYNIIDSACTSADFIADQSLGWHTAADGVLWKDWTAVGVDLSNHAGEQVYFRLTTYDCNEGSHYGYAYFTLECMRKNMNTVSCGDIDSNTLSAPEGFHYRWYTSQSSATVSTAQKITVPSQDITYFCEVSKLDNSSCNFTISAYGGTRYPMASFDTSMTIDSCVFKVTFTNTSGISNDGVTLLPGEQCETAYWDFDNGSTSIAYHGYTAYMLPGTYTVRLISGIALDECQDTAYMTLHLELPDGMAPSDTMVASICDNQWYTFYNSNYNLQGTYYHNVDIPDNTCDSIYVLQLDVRPTTVGDTTAVVCDSIVWFGQTYTVDGDYPSGPIGLNTVGCDTSAVLHLTVHPTYDTVDTVIICPYRPYVYRGVDYGGPVTFDTLLYSEFACDSVVHVTLAPRDSNYHLQLIYRFDSGDWVAPDSLLIGCAATTLYLCDTTPGAALWDWTLFFPDTTLTISDSCFSYDITKGQDSVTAFVTLVVISNQGCLDTVAWPLYVFTRPVPEFIWDPLVPSILRPETQFSNLSEPLQQDLDGRDSIVYLWRIQTMEGGSFDTTSVFSPFYHWGEQGDNMAGDYTVCLIDSLMHHADSITLGTFPWIDLTLFTVKEYPAFDYTCVDSVEHVVTITNEYLQFPNLVTPNGDGINDRWEVVNLLEFGNYTMNELWIYDRTGAPVYHVRDISSPEQFWDPQATRSPDGTYYYRFIAEGEYGVVKRNGLIEVLRK